MPYQVSRSEPRDNLGRVRAIRCGYGAGAPGKIKAPCVWFDDIAFSFHFFCFSRGCPCLENRFAAANGKDGIGGLGSPQNFSLSSLLVTKERMKTKNGKLKSKKVNALNIPKACRTAPHPSPSVTPSPTGEGYFAHRCTRRGLRLPRRGFATPRNDRF